MNDFEWKAEMWEPDNTITGKIANYQAQLQAEAKMKLWYVSDPVPHAEWLVFARTAENAVKIVVEQHNWSRPEELKTKEVVIGNQPGIVMYAPECL